MVDSVVGEASAFADLLAKRTELIVRSFTNCITQSVYCLVNVEWFAVCLVYRSSPLWVNVLKSKQQQERWDERQKQKLKLPAANWVTSRSPGNDIWRNGHPSLVSAILVISTCRFNCNRTLSFTGKTREKETPTAFHAISYPRPVHSIAQLVLEVSRSRLRNLNESDTHRASRISCLPRTTSPTTLGESAPFSNSYPFVITLIIRIIVFSLVSNTYREFEFLCDTIAHRSSIKSSVNHFDIC